MALPYTKIAIQKEFIKMLNETSLHNITVTSLSKRCQINRNTFYYHYTDLYQLLSEIFESELDIVIDEYNDTLSWEESFLLATHFALENKKAIYHIYNSLRREDLEKYIYDVSGNVMHRYVNKVNEDIGASEQDVLLIANFYQCALTEMVLQWIIKKMKDDPKKVIGRIGQLFDGNIEASLLRSKKPF